MSVQKQNSPPSIRLKIGIWRVRLSRWDVMSQKKASAVLFLRLGHNMYELSRKMSLMSPHLSLLSSYRRLFVKTLYSKEDSSNSSFVLGSPHTYETQTTWMESEAIHQNDHQARRRFVEWAQKEIAVVPDFHKRILLSDEAHFWFNGYVNKQNCRIWSEANPQVYVETPLHPEKLTVWCALWAGGILLQTR
ncbi:uncharacterized protein TNCV_4331561 [Trichonephila clavipes]|nr:uncharacterized protein TNCV_4331561 [Trichonephila clavipes]